MRSTEKTGRNEKMSVGPVHIEMPISHLRREKHLMFPDRGPL